MENYSASEKSVRAILGSGPEEWRRTYTQAEMPTEAIETKVKRSTSVLDRESGEASASARAGVPEPGVSPTSPSTQGPEEKSVTAKSEEMAPPVQVPMSVRFPGAPRYAPVRGSPPGRVSPPGIPRVAVAIGHPVSNSVAIPPGSQQYPSPLGGLGEHAETSQARTTANSVEKRGSECSQALGVAKAGPGPDQVGDPALTSPMAQFRPTCTSTPFAPGPSAQEQDAQARIARVHRAHARRDHRSGK
jgi:hypothetical protein